MKVMSKFILRSTDQRYFDYVQIFYEATQKISHFHNTLCYYDVH